jgi:nucleotide-binding universal stress UspA family protein
MTRQRCGNISLGLRFNEACNRNVGSFQSGRGSVKEELKVQVVDTGADMIVTGRHGHSLFREMTMGGVSGETLKDTSVPLLLELSRSSGPRLRA